MPNVVSAGGEHTVSPPSALHPRWLRRTALGLSSVFLWTMVLSAPIDALAHQPKKAPLPKYHAPTLPRPADDPAWHTIDYYKSEPSPAPLRSNAPSHALPPVASVTFPDRTKYITKDGSIVAGGQQWAPVGQIVDNNGNGITFNYQAGIFNQQTHFPGQVMLSSITDKNNVALLTVNRASNGNITSIADRYGRSVYYHTSTYATANVPSSFPQSQQELDHVLQVVPMGTAPSPTGTGTQTATINYLPGVCSGDLP